MCVIVCHVFNWVLVLVRISVPPILVSVLVPIPDSGEVSSVGYKNSVLLIIADHMSLTEHMYMFDIQ